MNTAFFASDRAFAWRLARSATRGQPGGPWRIRVDSRGISSAAPSMSSSCEWSAVTQLVEGDAAMVFVLPAGRWAISVTGLAGVDLSSEERASIRRWAEAAPGERTWITLRRDKASPRLRVEGAPG